MAWLCDVCKEPVHLRKNSSGGNDPTTCPLEKYRDIKSYNYSPEFKCKINQIFPSDFPLSDSPKDLKEFSKIVPEKTPLKQYLLLDDGRICGRPLVIESDPRSFFLHFNRILIELYYEKVYSYVDSVEIPERGQFNYAWLPPTTLRECYFGDKQKTQKRFKCMSDFLYPSLVIYPLGEVTSIKHDGWGKILHELITSRQDVGKPTWIVKSKTFKECAETVNNEELLVYLQTKVPTYTLNEEVGIFETPAINNKSKIKNNITSNSYLDK